MNEQKIDWRKKLPAYEAIELDSMCGEQDRVERADKYFNEYMNKTISYEDFMYYYYRGMEQRENDKYEKPRTANKLVKPDKPILST